MFKGLFFSKDPGGTNALIPIARKMAEEEDVRIFNFASSLAIPFWEQSGLDFTPLPELISKEEIDRLLRTIQPDFLFTGTSENTSLEGNFWLVAKQQGIFTYSVIDHWTQYRERYIVNDIFLPTDLIFTIDEVAEKQMIALGFRKENIVVSGQPHFEKFYNYESERSWSRFCEDHQLPPKKIILFVSDPVSISYPTPVGGRPVLGFDEHSILDALLDEMESMDLKNEFQLLIKLHPKEPENNFSKLIEEKNVMINYRILKSGNNLDLIFHSEFVIGMFTMLLFEAFLMNKPVLSLQLNATQVTNFGQSKIPIVTSPDDLHGTLRNFIAKKITQQGLPFKPSVKIITETIKKNLAKRPDYHK